MGELRDGGNTIVTTVEDVEAFRQQLIEEAQMEVATKAIGARIQAFREAPELRGRWLAAVKLMLASPGMSNAEIIAFVAANLPPEDAVGYTAPSGPRIATSWANVVGRYNRANRPLATPASGGDRVHDHHGDDHPDDDDNGWGAAVARHNRQREH